MVEQEKPKRPKRPPKPKVVVRAPRPGPMLLVAYRRLSTTKERQTNSFAVQERAILDWAGRQGGKFEIVWLDGIEDEASGGSLDREGIQRALGMIRAGDADGIVVHNVSRLSRDVGDFDYLVKEFQRLGAQIWVTDLNLDLTAPGIVQMIGGMMAMFAATERESTRQRNRATAAKFKAEGRAAGAALYGLQAVGDDNRLEPYQPEWANVGALWLAISRLTNPKETPGYAKLAQECGMKYAMTARRVAFALLSGRYLRYGLGPDRDLTSYVFVRVKIAAGEMFIDANGKLVQTANRTDSVTERTVWARSAKKSVSASVDVSAWGAA